MEQRGRDRKAIERVLDYVQEHLDEPLTPHRLADIAILSQFHFHRIFRAIVGESVMDHVRRLRLERAAFQLKTTDEPIFGIALDAGYGAHEAFTRTFEAYFGVSPNAYRRFPAAHRLPSPSGVHFGPDGFSHLRRAVSLELLEDDRLCPLHRQWPEAFEEQWEQFLEFAIGFGPLIYPPEFRTMPTTTDIDKEIDELQHEVEAAKQRLIEARRRRPREVVEDYLLKDTDGNDIRLSQLFGDKADLILIHNMGTGCVYCTMWADGFTGLLPHLSDRAAFVVCSPDKPEVQKRFAEKRHWNFKMVSAHDSSFVKDMGFWQEEGEHPGPWPGVSTFKKDPDGRIYRVAKSHLGPGDDFCAAFPLFDMLQEGLNGWEAKYNYGDKA